MNLTQPVNALIDLILVFSAGYKEDSDTFLLHLCKITPAAEIVGMQESHSQKGNKD